MEQTAIKSTFSRRPKLSFWLWRGALVGLVFWIGIDLFVPRQNNIREFDPKEVAQLETSMWRSYYDKNPVMLFWQLAGGLREQFHAPFWRSFKLAFQATKAAFVFKQSGYSRVGTEKTLPDLVSYYGAIRMLSTEPFDVSKVAKLELEWWIVHRQREHYSYADLANALAQTSAALYNQPASSFIIYAQLRADSMRICDEVRYQPGGATEADWQRIEQKLLRAWGALHKVVRPRNAHVL